MRSNSGIPRQKHRTRTERTRLVERFLQSDQTRVGFARQNGFSVSSLNRWLAEIAPPVCENPEQEFQEVQLFPSPPHALWAVEITGPSGTTIRLQQPPPVEDLLRLLGGTC